MTTVTHLTIDDLSTRWGMPRRTLQNLRTNGEGPPYIKITPKLVLYSLEAVEKFEADRTVTHVASTPRPV